MQLHVYLCFLSIKSILLFLQWGSSTSSFPIYFSLRHLTCSISFMSTKRHKTGLVVVWRSSAPKSLTNFLGDASLKLHQQRFLWQGSNKTWVYSFYLTYCAFQYIILLPIIMTDLHPTCPSAFSETSPAVTHSIYKNLHVC